MAPSNQFHEKWDGNALSASQKIRPNCVETHHSFITAFHNVKHSHHLHIFHNKFSEIIFNCFTAHLGFPEKRASEYSTHKIVISSLSIFKVFIFRSECFNKKRFINNIMEIRRKKEIFTNGNELYYGSFYCLYLQVL